MVLSIALSCWAIPAMAQRAGTAPRKQMGAEEKLQREATWAKAYHVNWLALTPTTLHTNQLRQEYSIAYLFKCVVLLQRLITLINLPKFRPVRPVGREVRLVIDFFAENGRKVATYVATRHYITTEDFKRGRKIDQAFRDVFELKLPPFKP